MLVYAPIVMYSLRLFIVVLQCLLNCLHVIVIRGVGFYHLTEFSSSAASGF